MDAANVRIVRFNPDEDAAPHIQTFRIPFRPGRTVLDALYEIYKHQDGSLAFRGSCMHGWCAVCAVRVNGVSVLPCKEHMQQDMLIEPVAGIPVIRDLIVQREDPKTGETMPCPDEPTPCSCRAATA